MAESESSEPDEPRTLTVVGMSGETLLDAVEVSSLAELQELVSARMTTEPGKSSSGLRFLTSDGQPFTSLDAPGSSTITAVAVSLSPVLQMLRLQDATGNLVNPTVPQEQQEEIAVKVARQLTSTACWFGGPGHLEGYPRIPWTFDDVMAPPPAFSRKGRGRMDDKMAIEVTPGTPVVHAGASVVFSLVEGSLVPMTLEDFTTEKHLTVKDIMELRRKHGHACHEKRRELLATQPDKDEVHPSIRVKEYGLDRVHLELGYSLHCEEVLPVMLRPSMYSRAWVKHTPTVTHITHASAIIDNVTWEGDLKKQLDLNQQEIFLDTGEKRNATEIMHAYLGTGLEVLADKGGREEFRCDIIETPTINDGVCEVSAGTPAGYYNFTYVLRNDGVSDIGFGRSAWEVQPLPFVNMEGREYAVEVFPTLHTLMVQQVGRLGGAPVRLEAG
ncbi:CCDC19 [Symbiodinium natans]|uniref:CCDC19 protein n=1 Tax=Symbiodinium natans TaxID=878477 RepID=A0A812RZ60_9DINO|nr:CCDC19 [Symbiodinium natans]